MTLHTLRSSFHTKVEERKLFWKALVDWLATATDDETSQLERALAPHAHHVRPLQQALWDAVADPATASLIPRRLHAFLHAAGWHDATPAMSTASVA